MNFVARCSQNGLCYCHELQIFIDFADFLPARTIL